MRLFYMTFNVVSASKTLRPGFFRKKKKTINNPQIVAAEISTFESV
jgi:hypothetical protein